MVSSLTYKNSKVRLFIAPWICSSNVPHKTIAAETKGPRFGFGEHGPCSNVDWSVAANSGKNLLVRVEFDD